MKFESLEGNVLDPCLGAGGLIAAAVLAGAYPSTRNCSTKHLCLHQRPKEVSWRICLALQMTRSNSFQLLRIFLEKLAEARQRTLNRLCEQILGRRCDSADRAPRDSILLEAVEDIAFAAGDGALEGGSCFHIFDNMAFRFAILMRVRPMLCFVAISVFS